MKYQTLSLLTFGLIALIAGYYFLSSPIDYNIDFNSEDDWIAFICGDYDTRNEHNGLYLLNLSEDSEASVLILDNDLPDSIRNQSSLIMNPSWSPDGQRIAFGSDEGIYLINSNGDNRNQLVMLVMNEQFSFPSYPSWSPDGQWIAFSSYIGEAWNLYQISANGGEIEQITYSGGILSRPAWSPDGHLIAFIRGSFETNMYIMDLATDELRQLENIEPQNPFITWSPDGEFIAFVQRNNSGNGTILDELYHIRLSDGNVNKATQNFVTVNAPSWSPDGEWIAFVGVTDWQSRAALYRIRPDGSDLDLLYASDECDASSPTWYLGSQQ